MTSNTCTGPYTAHSTSSFHSGKWTHEETLYVTELIKEFEAGSLNIEDSISLRRFLSKALNCLPKRISKKFEGTLYNGKQLYKRKTSDLTAEEVEKRRVKLKELECSYRESLKVLEMVEASRKPFTMTPHAHIAQGAEGRLSAFQRHSRGLGNLETITRSNGGLRETRIAQLKAEIALATLALEPANLRPGVPPDTSPQGTLTGLLFDRPTQSNILTALSLRQSAWSRESSAGKSLQDQAALHRLLSARSREILPVNIASLRAAPQAGSSLATQPLVSRHLVGLKHGLNTTGDGSPSSFKRFKLV